MLKFTTDERCISLKIVTKFQLDIKSTIEYNYFWTRLFTNKKSVLKLLNGLSINESHIDNIFKILQYQSDGYHYLYDNDAGYIVSINIYDTLKDLKEIKLIEDELQELNITLIAMQKHDRLLKLDDIKLNTNPILDCLRYNEIDF